MKAFISAGLLIFIIGNIGAADTDSYRFIDHLRAISRPGMPEIYEDSVLFTAPSSYNRVGISFAHEGYARVHWFRRLMVPKDSAEFTVRGRIQRGIDQNQDSGIMFHLEPIPQGNKYLDYRMIIDGLWTTDPLNPLSVSGPSGIVESRFPLPEPPRTFPDTTPPGTYRFNFRSQPGETVTVGGSFNNWDPFMYVLKEISPGFYTLSLPLPPGSFLYVFFHRGEQVPDPDNPQRLYTHDGMIASEGFLP